MKNNAVNQLNAGEVLYNEGDATGCLYMVVKGKVRVSGRGYAINGGVGSIFGLEQIDGESLKNLCYTPEGAGVYVLNGENIKGFITLLKSNKDYGGITVYNHAGFLKEYAAQYKRLCSEAQSIYTEIKEYYSAYIDLINTSGCKAPLIPEISQLSPFEPVYAGNERTEAFLEYSKIPLDIMKTFFASAGMLAADTVKSIYDIETDLQDACNEAFDYLNNIFMLYSGNDKYCLLRNMLGLGLDMKAAGKDVSYLDELIRGSLARRDRMKAIISQTTGTEWQDNDAEIRKIFKAYSEGKEFRDEDESESAADSNTIITLDALNDTLGQIIDYSGYPEEKTDELKQAVETFMNMEDREAVDDGSRKLRQTLTNHFYDLYNRVIIRFLEGKPSNAAIEMFLDFGLLSDRLLTQDQLAELAAIKRDFDGGMCRVYSMSSWLAYIYEGEREPSRNGMGLDYTEVLRDLKKQGTIDAADEKSLLSDKTKKLEHEIREVMIPGNRVVNGQLSVFVPFIHSGMFVGRMEKAFNSSARINEAVKKILDVDFSLFRRESLYADPEGGIDREYIMKEVLPEFIVYPIVGQNVIMWQEICGRKRDSEGRFFVPAFSYANLEDLMIKAFGRFKWDLCKTIQGPNWNNIKVHSLTSEYSDYIQYYKKNHDLSDERKEKVKLQIQRGRNNLREIFMLDYEVWIKNEANGAMKLNKPVREMLATYCPFSAPIKKRLSSQPMYEEAFMRDSRERGKKGKELSLRIKSYENKGVEIPPELLETLDYYTKM